MKINQTQLTKLSRRDRDEHLNTLLKTHGAIVVIDAALQDDGDIVSNIYSKPDCPYDHANIIDILESPEFAEVVAAHGGRYTLALGKAEESQKVVKTTIPS